MNDLIKLVAAAGFAFMVCLASSHADTHTWMNNTTGDWFTAGNWNESAVPVAGDDVVITNTGAYVILTNSTETDLSSLTLSKTLVFSNWDTTLNATNVTILTNGTMTLPGAFTNEAMSNNVYIVCSNLTVDAGGSINADAKGYAGGPATKNGNGTGSGLYSGGYGGGGGYGGEGGYSGGTPYGVSNAPTYAGSGGAGGSSYSGGNGGGAIYLEASGTITVNGTLTANGGSGTSYSGGGSGGGIYLVCNKLLGTNGILRANGGNTGARHGGGGGRIAVIYDQAAQSNVPVPTIWFSAAGGAGSSTAGDIGTLYFPDSRLLPETITHIGQWIVPGFTNWTPDNLTISNTWIRFPVDGFQLTVTNDLTILGSSGRLELGIISWPSYAISQDGAVLNVGGNLTLTNGGDLYIYSGMTNVSTTNYGALVSVTNDMFIASTTCWIYAYSHYTNGGSPFFRMRNLFISTNAGFYAAGIGFRGGDAAHPTGYGPGGGGMLSGYGYGGGYGGKGGGSLGGNTYGDSNAPVDPGSGGGGSGNGAGGGGGGTIRIDASGTITVNGTLNAYGGNGVAGYTGGGSGGGIYLTCMTLTGTSGVFSAYGGSGRYGGGGGRIAVWRVRDRTGGAIQTNVSGGIGSSGTGDVGTVVWGQLPPPRTVAIFR